jgi:tripartite-type tricarboxylate transporter receptor subunit TctC
MSRYRQHAVAVLIVALTAIVGGAGAQDYPARPITLVMPFPAGAPGDAMARNLSAALGTSLKQQVIIDNPSGAGGTIGSNKVAKSKPDGYKDFVAYAEANGQKLTFANAGPGSAAHLCALLFMNMTQTGFTEVPYKGAAPAMIDLLGGHVDLLCDQASTTSARIKAGTIKTCRQTS